MYNLIHRVKILTSQINNFLRLFPFLLFLFPGKESLAQTQENPIAVMTFNIQMTDAYYNQNKKEMVKNIILDNNVDIIGIQEFHIQAVRELQDLLPEYSWFGVGRDDGKIAGEMGPIFYRNDLFELIEEQTFWLSEWPEVPGSKSWNSSDTRMVTWGRFKIKTTGEIFYLFNTHFDHISVEAREKSSEMLLERTSSIAGDKPVVITGDFNFTENSNAYKILVADNPDRVKLFDAKYLSEQPSFGPAGTYNGYSDPTPNSKIDFIFVNPFVRVSTHGVIDDRPDGIWISDHFPVISRVWFTYPHPPLTPALKATAGDGKVYLSWNDIAQKETREPFNNNKNDFEGYKLYRSRSVDFSDATRADTWDIPYMREPVFMCDLIDGIKGYTNYGIQNGLGYYLGDDTGVQHFFVDSTVQNGVTYFYMITAYDYGISEMGKGFPPLESNYSFELDDDGRIINLSQNVVMITPHTYSREYNPPATTIEEKQTLGNAKIEIKIVDRSKLKSGHNYKIKFFTDSVANLRPVPQIRHKNDLLYTNSGFKIFDQTENDSLIYFESPLQYSHKNIETDIYLTAGNIFTEYWYLNPLGVESDIFDGLQVTLNKLPEIFAQFDSVKSGWLKGNSPIGIRVNSKESVFFPWQYDIVFHDENFIYTSKTNKKNYIRSSGDEPLVSSSLLLGQTFNFEVVNKSFTDESGNFEQMDMLVHDVNRNGIYEPDSDYVLVGHAVEYNSDVYWAGTVFSIDFHSVKSSDEMPSAGDVFRVDFSRPFIESDSIIFSVEQGESAETSGQPDQKISVIPNPYIVTNAMEKSGEGYAGRLMFSNVPAQCVLTILSVSGIQIRKISVNNTEDNGSVFWDLKSDAGNRIAPGYYIYHVKSENGFEQTGKFAVIR